MHKTRFREPERRLACSSLQEKHLKSTKNYPNIMQLGIFQLDINLGLDYRVSLNVCRLDKIIKLILDISYNLRISKINLNGI